MQEAIKEFPFIEKMVSITPEQFDALRRLLEKAFKDETPLHQLTSEVEKIFESASSSDVTGKTPKKKGITREALTEALGLASQTPSSSTASTSSSRADRHRRRSAMRGDLQPDTDSQPGDQKKESEAQVPDKDKSAGSQPAVKATTAGDKDAKTAGSKDAGSQSTVKATTAGDKDVKSAGSKDVVKDQPVKKAGGVQPDDKDKGVGVQPDDKDKAAGGPSDEKDEGPSDQQFGFDIQDEDAFIDDEYGRSFEPHDPGDCSKCAPLTLDDCKEIDEKLYGPRPFQNVSADSNFENVRQRRLLVREVV